MRCLLIFLSIFVLSSLNAQLTDTSYSHVAYWTVGDTMDYRYTEEEHNFKFADKVDSTVTSYDYSLIVQQENDTTYRMVLHSGENYESSDPIIALLQDSMYECGGEDMIYTASALGNYGTILNLPEVSRATDDCMRSVMKKFDFPDAMIDKLSKETIRPFQSPAKYIKSDPGTPIALYHSFYGRNYPINDTIYYQEEINTVEGTLTVPGDAYFIIYDIDTISKYLFIKNVIELDPTALRRSATHHTLMGRARGDFDQLNLRDDSEKEIREEIAEIDFRVQIVKIYKIHYPTGYPLEIYMKKTSRSGDFDSDNEYWDNTVVETKYLDFLQQRQPSEDIDD